MFGFRAVFILRPCQSSAGAVNTLEGGREQWRSNKGRANKEEVSFTSHTACGDLFTPVHTAGDRSYQLLIVDQERICLLLSQLHYIDRKPLLQC